MCFTLLIESAGKQTTARKVTGCGHRDVRTLFASSRTEAEQMLRNEKVDLLLYSLDSGDPGVLGQIAGSAKNMRGTKIVVFSTRDELTDTLRSFENHSTEELKRLFSSDSQQTALPASLNSSIEDFTFQGLIGSSSETQKVKDLVVKIAPTGTTVLIQGESGTGKEVIARAIHYHSARRKQVFMPVDCAAINESVIESELFGHTKGAFTGADWNTLGLIRSADGGTLFLDEIAELPLHLQAKLLRTLQEKVVKPVGSSKIHPVDIRIVSATNRNLAEAVKQGLFRQDLYYRLSTVTIYSPPLRERISDLPLLCDHFLKQLGREGFPEKQLSGSALAALCAYEWPGNIRELENVIRSAVAFSAGDTIRSGELSIPVTSSAGTLCAGPAATSTIAFHEKEAIRKALEKTIGNRRAAAKLLGISEATLYRRLKLYCI